MASSAAIAIQPVRAARLCGATEGLLRRQSQRMQPVDQAEFERSVAAARAQMDEEAFAAAWAEGRAMSLDQAIQLALAEAVD